MDDVHIEDLSVDLTVTDGMTLTPDQEERVAEIVRRELEMIERGQIIGHRNSALGQPAARTFGRD